jgi:hypothetical protein
METFLEFFGLMVLARNLLQLIAAVLIAAFCMRLYREYGLVSALVLLIAFTCYAISNTLMLSLQFAAWLNVKLPAFTKYITTYPLLGVELIGIIGSAIGFALLFRDLRYLLKSQNPERKGKETV